MKKCLQIRDMRSFPARAKRAARKVRQNQKKRASAKGITLDGRALPIRIRFPSSISIQNKFARRALISSLKAFKNEVGTKPITLDFSKVVFQYPTGVLLLVSEIDRQKRALGRDFDVDIILPDNEVSRQVFHQVGIASLCGKVSPRDRNDYDETVRHWRYATGTMMTEEPGKALEQFEGQLSDELRAGIWKGVSEAIINSIHHAYIEPRNDGFRECRETRWWMFSHVSDGELTVAVCDLGIGIPRSLPLRWDMSKLQAILDRLGLGKPDLAAVKAALEIGATRTGQENRGRGLPQIWQDMKAHRHANILLLSNRALLRWSQKTHHEVGMEFEDNIYGTLVMWSVPIDASANRI